MEKEERERERDRQTEERVNRVRGRGTFGRNRVISFVAYGWLSSLPPYIKYVSH